MMNRRNWFKRMATVATAVVATPMVLPSVSAPDHEAMTVGIDVSLLADRGVIGTYALVGRVRGDRIDANPIVYEAVAPVRVTGYHAQLRVTELRDFMVVRAKVPPTDLKPGDTLTVSFPHGVFQFS